jgi:hypothetical protein
MTPKSETKQKLTLTVDAETVEAAKKLGLNISEVTERVLKGYTFDPDRAEEGVSRKQYRELIGAMDPLLTKYRSQVLVGWISTDSPSDDGEAVFYSGDGQLYSEEDIGPDAAGNSQVVQQAVSTDSVDFLRPAQILKNFFAAIESAKNRRREEVEGLLLAKRLVEALSEQEARHAIAGQTGTKKGGHRK